MKLRFSVWEKRADGSRNRRFFKIQYTAALRLGLEVEARNGRLEVDFEGEATTDVQAHEGKTALKGMLRIDGRDSPDVVVIARRRTDGKYDLVTFWPESQHPDAHQSYTDPLVDTAMDGTPYPVRVVATKMHAAFEENAGVSPATLMKKLYEQENLVLKDAAEHYAALLEQSEQERQQAKAERDQERSERLKAEADAADSKAERDQERSERLKAEADAADSKAERDQERSERLKAEAELEKLRQDAMRVARSGEKVRKSNVAILERVAEGKRGRNDQRAILLFMSDGTIRANNWPGGYEARLNYARRLVGRRVRTDVWGEYRWQDWFQNIYPEEA